MKMAIKRATARRSFIYVDILSAAECVQLQLLELTHARRTFNIKQIQPAFHVVAKTYGIIGTIKITSEAIQIEDSLTKRVAKIPKLIFVTPSEAKRVRELMNSEDATSTLMAIHSHEAVPSVLLETGKAA
jgi:hypothetical protein